MNSVVKVVFMGTPDFAVPVLEGLIDSGYPIVGVYTKPDTRQGRGQELSISAVKKAALARQLPIYQPRSLRPEGEVDILRTLVPGLIVVAAYGLILPPAVLSLPPYRCLNVHPSLLPKYRGSSPVGAAILGGEDQTGVSIMLMDEGTDTGPVVAQTAERILPEDTTGSLTARLARIGARLLVEVIPKWVKGEVRPAPQQESLATYSRALKKEDGEIDWSRSADHIERQVRALQPWPGCYSFWKGKRLKIIRATTSVGAGLVPALPVIASEARQSPAPGDREGSPLRTTGPAASVGAGLVPARRVESSGGVPLSAGPGTVVSIDHGGGVKPAVVTGNGLLVLETLQLEGKRQMRGEEFVLGQRDFVGSILA